MYQLILIYKKITMPKNKTGGRNHKRRGNKHTGTPEQKVLEVADENQEYARVIKRLGGEPPNISLECNDGKPRIGIVRGKFKKRVWINEGDIVLVTLESHGNDDKCSIVHRYAKTDIRQLRQRGLIKFDEDGDEDDAQFEFKTKEEMKQVSARDVGTQNFVELDFGGPGEDSDDEAAYMEMIRAKFRDPVDEAILEEPATTATSMGSKVHTATNAPNTGPDDDSDSVDIDDI